jgi:tetratricopeptide (TPR) repeat protein
MSKPKVFISYSHADEKKWKNRLQKHLKVLERHGSLSFWDDRQIAAGQEWRAEIKSALDSADAAILLISTDFLGSNFINDEEVPAILQRRISDGMKVFPLVVRSCLWQKVPWLEPLQARPIDGKPLGRFRGDDIDRILAELVSEIDALLNQLQPKPPAATETQAPMAAPPADECPYLGLEAFTEDKEHLFFGRDDFADALFAKVKRQNFVVLVGPSGCGKSSVVQAGLFPRLRRDMQKWEIILFPPREDPFLSLAAGFVWRWQPQANFAVNTNEAKKLAAEMKDSQRMIEAVHRTVAAPDGHLLLVVDQFEEMFTLCDESDRRAFLGALLDVKDAAPVTILLTLRADFMGQAQSFSSAFSQLLDESMVSHRPLTPADLEAVITGPAQCAGLDFEPGLVDLILQEVTSHPDSLPLLEYSLKEMWRKRRGQLIGRALYEAVGKVEGAISQHADAVLHALPEAEQSLALRALTKLVRVAGEEGEADTRLRLPLTELSEVERAVLQEFISKRLLVTKCEEGTGIDTIEVAHEALIRRWEKLRGALDSDREFLIWRRRLDYRRREWEMNQRHESLLLRGPTLDEARRWLNERVAELTSSETEFITWEDRPEFHVEHILNCGPELAQLEFAEEDGEEIRTRWFTTLVYCDEVDRAISHARAIKYVKALVSISRALIKVGKVEKAQSIALEALGFARASKSGWDRDSALGLVIEALATTGLISTALVSAREIETGYSQVDALIFIVEALARTGSIEKAREVALEGLAILREKADSNIFRVGDIMVVFSRLGMTGKAAELAQELLSIISSKEQEIIGWNFKSIALSLAKVGMVTEALTIASKLSNEEDRNSAQRLIAKEMTKRGMTVGALAAIREIPLNNYRARVLGSFAMHLAEADSKTAREIALESLAVAREIEYLCAPELALVARALTKVGLTDEAREASREALTDAREAEDAWDLMTVINYWITVGEIENAYGMIKEVRIAVNNIYTDYGRSEALGNLAEILARMHSYRDARETAEQCSITTNRLAAYTTILREYHIERDPSLARLFAEEKEEEEDD